MQNLIRRGTQFVFLFVLFGTLVVSARAATFTVNSTANTTDADTMDNLCDVDLSTAGEQCTLRAAIQQANATPGADVIVFDLAVFGSAQTISLNSGLPEITEHLTITGTSPALLTIDGTENVRPFRIASGAAVEISNLSVIRGFVGESSGGCISNLGSLTLTNAVVRDCEAVLGNGGGIYSSGTLNISGSSIYNNNATGGFLSGDGGGIYNQGGTASINNSTVRDNQADNSGGGIANDSGTVNITRSTIGSATPLGSNRAGNSGGGIFNVDGTTNLTNSTISGNFATNFGGGYYGFSDIGTSTLTATQTTIANNQASNGGGIAVSAAVGVSGANINNTIVGDNTASSSGSDIFGALGNVISSGYNLIENTSGSNVVLLPTDQSGVDPRLLPLALNGGTTETHALQNSGGNISPAIDKGNNTGTDQRGVPRPIDNPNVPPAAGGNNSDIGAFEAAAGTTAASVTISGRVVSVNGRGIGNAHVVLIEAGGTVRQTVTNSFGYYRFADVAAGQTATLEVRSKRYGFAPQIININGEMSDLNFIAQP
ncbi:MAG: carboxypeptidase-like regulatory domain-containing protein [Acidobacteriota bacterium]|nr:carboxypeptidase-like regulatory domain-containing protein [Acidobacteriota bacterium]